MPSPAPELESNTLVDALQNASLEQTPNADPSSSPARDFVSYTQAELLFLSRSPLVKAPEGMPPLKDWFGEWTEQSSGKKDAEPSATSTTPRDRRFRRDQEDGAEPPPRATFRSTLSQPSQMGNFKHQSIRSTDKDKDKDGDKDREREIRDREGQERLRSLSDKYDRDRMSLPQASGGLRTRERDSAPHLSASSSRLGSQSSLATASGRRNEGRDTTRRKAGESSEDWRRGRDDRAEGARREREDRDRPRSRVRETSRSRRDPSPTSRRDRDDKERDRDDHRRGKDDHLRRDRDNDRDSPDDSRRWRDDGKREERLAARRELREREYRERDKERTARGNGGDRYENSWESERPRDRWNVADERDSRTKRTNGRDKRADSGDEGRERPDRRGGDRDREKEPAWMDTYVPSGAAGGILGGKSADGELDSIQAWKKGMKEKEQKEKGQAVDVTGAGLEAPSTTIDKGEPITPDLAAGGQMDEIQLFKLIMKREEHKRTTDAPAGSPSVPTSLPTSSESTNKSLTSTEGLSSDIGHATGSLAHVRSNVLESSTNVTAPDISTQSSMDGSRSLLSLGSLPSATEASLSGKPTTPSLDSPSGSRFFPNPSPSDAVPAQTQSLERTSTASIKSPVPGQFNPPPGSRLLAFGSRTPSAASSTMKGPILGGPQQTLGHQPSASSPFSGDVPRTEAEMIAQLKLEQSRAQRSYSPLEQQYRSSYPAEDRVSVAQQEAMQRQGALLAERGQYNGLSDSGAGFPEHNLSSAQTSGGFSHGNQSPSFESGIPGNGLGGAGYPQPRGSRFAKFFDGKSRDPHAAAMAKAQGGLGATSPSGLTLQRNEMGLNDGLPRQAENRTMEDIFAMLQNSANHQGQRLTPVNAPGQLSSLNNGQYLQGSSSLPPIHQQQNLPPARAMDMLYDNRLDDRNFVPDGMVPGLRTAPAPRNRDGNGGMLHDPMDDMAFSVHTRLPPQRSLDQMYNGPVPAMYSGQQGLPRNAGPPLQQPFRNGSSPIPGQNPMQGHLPQRLPPGLANLGVRPPHEPSQFLGPAGMTPNGPGQFNVGGGGLGGYPGGPQLRGPAPPQQLQNQLLHNQMNALGHPNKFDMRPDIRGPSQAQMLNMGNGVGVGVGAGLRGPAAGFGLQQGNAQMHAPHMAMRQQPPHQQIPPHMLPQMLPPHLQQQGQAGVGVSQPAHDLMALLMGGPPRD